MIPLKIEKESYQVVGHPDSLKDEEVMVSPKEVWLIHSTH